MELNINMKQLKYVITLSETGSFSSAAAELGISQPSLSQYVKKIEKQVGIELFERTNGFVRLSDAGRVYIDCARKILNIEHQLETEILDISENKTGSVIVGTAPYRSTWMMPEIAKEFKKKYPGIHIIVEELVTSELIQKAEKGLFDICIVPLPPNTKAFSTATVMEEEVVLAVPKSYPPLDSEKISVRKYPAVDVSVIDNQKFVMITENQVMGQILNNLCNKYDVSVDEAVVVKSLEAQINMVKASLGMAIVPTGIERLCSKDDVVFYSFKQEIPTRKIVALWRNDRKLPKVVQDLIQIAQSVDW